MPAVVTRMSTSPSPGSGTGASSTSSRTSGPPHAETRIARMGATVPCGGSLLDPEGCPMSLTVVGSIAFDAVDTPTASRPRLLGGSAVHFSIASSFFAETRVVGPVGDDFGDEEYAVLHD